MFRLLALSFALVSYAFADSFRIWPLEPPKPPFTPDAQYPEMREYEWYKEFQDHIDFARSHPVDILFDGDSLIDRFQTDGASVWKDRFVSMNPIDFAEGHDPLQIILWRITNGELEGLHPKLIVLDVGQGNVQPGNVPDVVRGIAAAVDIYRKSCPEAHIVLLGILPHGMTAADPMRTSAKDANALLAKLYDGQHVTFLDIGDKFLLPDGSRNPQIPCAPDFESMSPKGFQILADMLQPFVDRYCPKAELSTLPSAPGDTSHEPAVKWPYQQTDLQGVWTVGPPFDWIRDFERSLDSFRKTHADLIFDGDSITYGWRGSGNEVWAQRYGKFQALDMGIPSDRVQHMLWRMTHGELDGQDPKLVALLIGTNNAGDPPADVAGGVRLAVQEVEKRCAHAHILVQGVFPRGHEAGSDLRKWVKQVNAIMAAWPPDPRCTYLDFGDKFLSADGTLSADIMPDFLHPDARGYVIWGDAIQPIVDKYLVK